MILRIAIFIGFVVFIIFGERNFLVLTNIGITKGAHVAIILLLLSFALLCWEIIENIRMQKKYSAARKKIFMFSFFLGGIWGLMGTFSAGLSVRVNPLILIFNFSIAGMLFGFIGVSLAKFIFGLYQRSNTK